MILIESGLQGDVKSGCFVVIGTIPGTFIVLRVTNSNFCVCVVGG